jgi:hypothetical protein
MAKIKLKQKNLFNYKKLTIKKIFFLSTQKLYLFFKKIFHYFFFQITLRPKLVLIFVTSFIATLILFFGISKIFNYTQNLLPTTINISIRNENLCKKIKLEISKELILSKRKKDSRNYFLKKVNNILYSYDELDTYKIRLGLDQVLNISATPQIPIFLIEIKGGEKFIVSQSGNIIEKYSKNENYPNLFNIYAPEIKFNWIPKAQKLKTNSLNSPSIKMLSSNKIVPNFSWLINQSKIIIYNLNLVEFNMTPHEIIWNNITGFKIRFIKQNGDNVYIHLGKTDLLNKLKKIPSLLKSISNKNLFPSEIDLDFIDKASLKI